MSHLALLLATLLALLPLALAAEGNSRFHSAKCIADGRKCTEYLERQSGACVRAKPPRRQSKTCFKQACQWCAVDGKADIFPCMKKVLRVACKLGKVKKVKEVPVPMPSPMKKGKGKGMKKGGKKMMMEEEEEEEEEEEMMKKKKKKKGMRKGMGKDMDMSEEE